MTSEYAVAFSRHGMPELISKPSQKEEGAGKTGCLANTHGPRAGRSARGRNHRHGRCIPAFPARRFYGLYALSSGTGVLAPVTSRDAQHHRKAWRQLRDARTTRLRRPQKPRSSAWPKSRCEFSRPSHPALNARNDREAPLSSSTGRRKSTTNSEKTKVKYFSIESRWARSS
jgi:hypothetical protein